MATEKQTSFFKSLYDEESERYKILQEHAKNNLTLVTLYSAFLIFIMSGGQEIYLVGKVLLSATTLCMLLAFLMSLWATQISVFEAVNTPSDILKGMGDVPPSDEEFFDDRIVDYTVACERNSKVNDAKANWLVVARYFLLAGIALHAGYFLARIGLR